MDPMPLGECIRELVDTIDHFQKRVVQEAIREATADHWLRKAEEWDRVPDPDSDTEIARRARSTARACREKAEILRRYGLDPDGVAR